jgi:methyl-accepting chemotaxis protein
MNVPISLAKTSASFNELKTSTDTFFKSTKNLGEGLKGLNNQQLISTLTSKNHAKVVSELSNGQLYYALRVAGVEQAQARELTTKLKLLAVKKLNKELTKEEAAEYDKLQASVERSLSKGRPNMQKQAKSTGMVIGTSIMAGIFAVTSGYNSGKQAQTAGEKWGSAFSSGFSGAMSGLMAGAMIGGKAGPWGAAIGGAVGLLSAAIGHFANANQKAIDKANELTKAWEEQRKTIQQTRNSIDSISERYEKLSKGVGKNNSNISLSNEEHKEWLDISNQIADMLPDLVSHWDENGNAVLKHKGDVEKLNEEYRKLQETLNFEILNNAGDVWKGFIKETKRQKNGTALKAITIF